MHDASQAELVVTGHYISGILMSIMADGAAPLSLCGPVYTPWRVLGAADPPFCGVPGQRKLAPPPPPAVSGAATALYQSAQMAVACGGH